MKLPTLGEVKKASYKQLVTYCKMFGLGHRGKASLLRQQLIVYVKKNRKRKKKKKRRKTKRNDRSLLDCARTQIMLNRPNEALDTLENIKKKDRFYWLEKGNCSMMLDRPEEALECYDRALVKDKGFKDALVAKQNLLMELSRHEEALKVNLKLPEDDQNPLVHLILLQNSGKIMEALRYCDLILDKQELESVLNIKGLLLMRFERFREALECFEHALAVNADIPEAWNNKAVCLSKLGLYFEAEEAIQKAIELDATYATAWSNRAVFAYSTGKLIKATEHFEEALRHMQTTKAWNTLGLIHLERENLEDAAECFDKAISLDNTCAEAWNNKGILFEKMKKKSAAKNCFEKALTLQPDFEAAERNIARVKAR